MNNPTTNVATEVFVLPRHGANDELPPAPPMEVIAARLDASIEWLLYGRVTTECIGVADMIALRELLRQHGV